MNEKELIKIASKTKYYGLDDNCKKKVSVKNRICGDEVFMGLNQNKDKVFFETNSCILTQASCAILAENLKTINKQNVKSFIKNIESFFLKNTKISNELKMFKKLLIKENKNRKECIVLPLKALEKLLND
jgi:nitrogen fixation NifU-like protein